MSPITHYHLRNYQGSSHLNKESNEIGLKYAADLIDELREVVHVQEFSAKHGDETSYNSR